MNIIILRGPSAVGKTTISNELVLKLKDMKLSPALISEDHFRKQIQRKYKADDKVVHINSTKLIQGVISTLLIDDSYDVIIIEGLVRYEEMLNSYIEFCKKNDFKLKTFQLSASLDERLSRNVTEDRDHSVEISNDNAFPPEKIQLKESTPLDTSKGVADSIDFILKEAGILPK